MAEELDMEFLEHYGTPRHSGRYPWGSGKDPYQRSVALKKYVDQLKKEGVKETEMATMLGFRSTKQLRAFISISNSEIKKQQYLEAQKLQAKGYSNKAIGEALKPPMGESSVRNLLDPAKQARQQVTENIAEALKSGLKDGKIVDLGEGTELHLGTNATKLNTAVEYLRQQGYKVYEYKQLQQATGKYTNMKVLCPPDMTFQEMYKNREKIGLPTDWVADDGFELMKVRDPVRVDRNRILVRYAEEGGVDRDGTVELRPGVADLSLGDASYAQVRIAVEGDRYMKGMAYYTTDIPKGYDIVYNTNKAKGSPDDKVFKPMESDPENPFGANIQQRDYDAPDGTKHLSAINKVGGLTSANEEGKWETWAKKLPAQFLAKQPVPFAKKQLKLLADSKEEELEEIKKLTNPVVKRQLLMDFADSCDSSSIHLEAAALPRQATRVLLPEPTLKDNEIYAPGFKAGEEVALVRFPHAGTFEIPKLTVVDDKTITERYSINGREPRDAVRVNKHVADRLSGADFDGDTVLVLPTSNQKIKSTDPLKGLEGFDSKQYKLPEGVKNKMQDPKSGERRKQMEMGKVSNLITDMTIRGANEEEMARAVRHSMVVIDAKKHNLDYEQSYRDNDIASLVRDYQFKESTGRAGGSSTLLSSAKSPVNIDTFRTTGIDKETGKIIRQEKPNDTYMDPKTGKVKHRQTEVPKLSIVEDAYELSSGSKIEAIYAEHSNRLKAMANEARKEAVNTKNIPYSPSAKKTYVEEVASLNAKLNDVLKNKPLERAAQAIASTIVDAQKKADPSLRDNKDKLKKIRNKAQAVARARTGAKRPEFYISDREWEAIQAGAISSTTLAKILTRADKDRVRALATPRDSTVLTPSVVSRAQGMIANGMSIAEASEALGISPSSVNRALDM